MLDREISVQLSLLESLAAPFSIVVKTINSAHKHQKHQFCTQLNDAGQLTCLQKKKSWWRTGLFSQVGAGQATTEGESCTRPVRDCWITSKGANCPPSQVSLKLTVFWKYIFKVEKLHRVALTLYYKLPTTRMHPRNLSRRVSKIVY